MSNTFCIKAWWQQQCGICCCFYEQPSNMVYGGWELYISSVPFTLLFRTQEKGTPLLPLLLNSFWPFFFNPGEGFIRTRPCPNTRPRRRVYPSCPSTGPRRRVYLSLPYYQTQEKGLPALPYLFWT